MGIDVDNRASDHYEKTGIYVISSKVTNLIIPIVIFDRTPKFSRVRTRETVSKHHFVLTG